MVNAPEEMPESQPDKGGQQQAANRSRSAPAARSYPIKKFLEYEGKILRYALEHASSTCFSPLPTLNCSVSCYIVKHSHL